MSSTQDSDTEKTTSEKVVTVPLPDFLNPKYIEEDEAKVPANRIIRELIENYDKSFPDTPFEKLVAAERFRDRLFILLQEGRRLLEQEDRPEIPAFSTPVNVSPDLAQKTYLIVKTLTREAAEEIGCNHKFVTRLYADEELGGAYPIWEGVLY